MYFNQVPKKCNVKTLYLLTLWKLHWNNHNLLPSLVFWNLSHVSLPLRKWISPPPPVLSRDHPDDQHLGWGEGGGGGNKRGTRREIGRSMFLFLQRMSRWNCSCFLPWLYRTICCGYLFELFDGKTRHFEYWMYTGKCIYLVLNCVPHILFFELKSFSSLSSKTFKGDSAFWRRSKRKFPFFSKYLCLCRMTLEAFPSSLPLPPLFTKMVMWAFGAKKNTKKRGLRSMKGYKCYCCSNYIGSESSYVWTEAVKLLIWRQNIFSLFFWETFGTYFQRR